MKFLKHFYLSILFLFCCTTYGQNQQFKVYVYFNKSGKNYKISSNHINPQTITFFMLQKKVPVEDFEYSLQEIIPGKMSKVEKQNWREPSVLSLSFRTNPAKSFEIKKLQKENLKTLNIIYTDSIEKIKFKSIINVINKADAVYVIKEKDTRNNNGETLTAYKVEVVRPLGEL